MILGIVGSEAAKFDERTEALAKKQIRDLVLTYRNFKVNTLQEICSGDCHLGGIDKWAEEITWELRIPFKAFPPRELNWNGYKARNLQIARRSHMVICITVAKYPELYKGMKFLRCYHCDTNTHVKSGGCWTVKKAESLGKVGRVIVIR